MTKYSYYIDEKVMIWRREHITIEADSKEEADIIASLKTDDGSYIDNSNDFEMIYDTEEGVSYKDNNNHTTLELYNDGGDIIWDNEPKEVKRDNKINQIIQ